MKTQSIRITKSNIPFPSARWKSRWIVLGAVLAFGTDHITEADTLYWQGGEASWRDGDNWTADPNDNTQNLSWVDGQNVVLSHAAGGTLTIPLGTQSGSPDVTITSPSYSVEANGFTIVPGRSNFAEAHLAGGDITIAEDVELRIFRPSTNQYQHDTRLHTNSITGAGSLFLETGSQSGSWAGAWPASVFLPGGASVDVSAIRVRSGAESYPVGFIREGGSGSVTINGVVTIEQGRLALGHDVIVNARLTGAGGLFMTRDRVDRSGGTVVLNHAENDYLGPTAIGSTHLRLNAGDNTLPAGTVMIWGIPDPPNHFRANTDGFLDLNGNDQHVGALIAYNHPDDWTQDSFNKGGVRNTDSGQQSTLTIGGTTDGNFVWGNLGQGGTNFRIVMEGPNTQILDGVASYTGTTTINGGALIIHGDYSNATGAVIVNAGGTLGGRGTLGGELTVHSGGVLSPGSSIGTMTTSDVALEGGSVFVFEFSTNCSTGAAGTEWDWLNIEGTLDLTGASSGDPIIVKLVTMEDQDTPGLLQNWNPEAASNWLGFVTTTGGITGFSPDLFVFDTSDFQNDLDEDGFFSVVLNNGGLDLAYIPEPTSTLLVFLAAVWAVGNRRRHPSGKINVMRRKLACSPRRGHSRPTKLDL